MQRRNKANLLNKAFQLKNEMLEKAIKRLFDFVVEEKEAHCQIFTFYFYMLSEAQKKGCEMTSISLLKKGRICLSQ